MAHLHFPLISLILGKLTISWAVLDERWPQSGTRQRYSRKNRSLSKLVRACSIQDKNEEHVAHLHYSIIWSVSCSETSDMPFLTKWPQRGRILPVRYNQGNKYVTFLIQVMKWSRSTRRTCCTSTCILYLIGTTYRDIGWAVWRSDHKLQPIKISMIDGHTDGLTPGSFMPALRGHNYSILGVEYFAKIRMNVAPF